MLPYACYWSVICGFSDQLFFSSQLIEILFQNFEFDIMRTFEGLHRIYLFKYGGTNKNFYFLLSFSFFLSFSFYFSFFFVFFPFEESSQLISCTGKSWGLKHPNRKSQLWYLALRWVFFLSFFFLFIISLSFKHKIACIIIMNS